MALTNKRIIDLPERTTLNDDDYTAVDGANGGTGKYKLSQLQEDIGDVEQTVTDHGTRLTTAEQNIETNANDIVDLKEDLKQKTGLSEDVKIALLDCFEHVAWIDEHGQTYYDTLEDALYPAVYPLENGAHTFTTNDRTLVVTDGHHIKYNAPNATSDYMPKGAYLNLSKVSENDDSATDTSNINKSTVLFTIPANASVRFVINNINYETLATDKYALALRNGSTSVITTGDQTSNDDIVIDTTVETDTPITCVFAYLRNQYKTFEADIHLYVNGKKWI